MRYANLREDPRFAASEHGAKIIANAADPKAQGTVPKTWLWPVLSSNGVRINAPMKLVPGKDWREAWATLTRNGKIDKVRVQGRESVVDVQSARRALQNLDLL